MLAQLSHVAEATRRRYHDTMRFRRVSPEVFLRDPVGRAPSPRELRRTKLEVGLERVIREVAEDPGAVFQVSVLADEKPSTVRAAFRRVKARMGADGVRLVTVDGKLYITGTTRRRSTVR